MAATDTTNNTTRTHGNGDDPAHTATIDGEAAEHADREWMNDRGQLIETFISSRTFMAQEDAMRLVIDKPAGWQTPVGTIAGFATGCERREVQAAPGQQQYPASVWIRGQFQAVVGATGEVKSAPNLILPRAAGDMIEAAFAAGATGVMLDIEMTLQKARAGRYPYQWGVRVFGSRQSEADRAVAAVRQRQEARQQQRRLAAPATDPTVKTA